MLLINVEQICIICYLLHYFSIVFPCVARANSFFYLFNFFFVHLSTQRICCYRFFSVGLLSIGTGAATIQFNNFFFYFNKIQCACIIPFKCLISIANCISEIWIQYLMGFSCLSLWIGSILAALRLQFSIPMYFVIVHLYLLKNNNQHHKIEFV